MTVSSLLLVLREEQTTQEAVLTQAFGILKIFHFRRNWEPEVCARKKKISPKMLQCSGECYIHSLESQIGRILTFWCLKINGEKSYLTLTIFSCCHFYTIANIIIATPHLCMVRTMLPKMFCFLLMFFKMQHFGCLISRLLKMHDVKENILPLVLNTKQPLSDIWYLRFQQNNLTNF